MPRTTLIIPTLAALIASAGLVAADGANVQVHGFVSQGYLLTKGNHLFGDTRDEGTFDFNEVGLNVTATPVEHLRVSAQIFAFDLGSFGNDKLSLDYAFGDYRLPVGQDDAVGITAGRFKVLSGLYNDARDLDMTRPQVFLPLTIYPADFRDAFLAINGVQVYGSLRTGRFGSFDATACLGGTNIDAKEGGIAKTLARSPITGLQSIDVERIEGATLTWNTPVDGLRLRGTVIHSTNLVVLADSTSPVPGSVLRLDIPDFTMATASVEWQHGPFTLASEYQRRWYRIDTSLVVPVAAPVSRNDIAADFAYASLAWRFHPVLEGFVGVEFGREHSDLFETVYQRGYTAGLRWDITDHWLVKVQYQHNVGTLLLSTSTNTVQRNDWDMFALKTTFDF